MSEGQWYYCLDHKAVEPYDACKADSRLGPYATREDAQHALEKAAERNEAWDNDPKWNDLEEREDDDEGGSAFDALRP